jgi:hypothetical protein
MDLETRSWRCSCRETIRVGGDGGCREADHAPWPEARVGGAAMGKIEDEEEARWAVARELQRERERGPER